MQRLLVALLCIGATGCSPPTLFEHESASTVAGESNAALPRGFRRTNDGWEDATYWHLGPDYQDRPLQSWIDELQDREPPWLRHALDRIRQMPPLMVAVIQVATIAVIFKIHASHVRSCPSRMTGS
ncbi:MAG: hypothetical protein AAGJ83_01555 [Planctomycetota bacterium]